MRKDPILPKILVDTREKKPYLFKGFETERRTLNVGDYWITGSSEIVERKSLTDFIGTVGRLPNRMRFEREMRRARTAKLRLWVIVEARLDTILAQTPEYTNMHPGRMMESFLELCIAYDVMPIFAGDRDLAEKMTLYVLRRGYSRRVNR